MPEQVKRNSRSEKKRARATTHTFKLMAETWSHKNDRNGHVIKVTWSAKKRQVSRNQNDVRAR